MAERFKTQIMSWYSYGPVQSRGQPLHFESYAPLSLSVQGERFEMVLERRGTWRKTYLRRLEGFSGHGD